MVATADAERYVGMPGAVEDVVVATAGAGGDAVDEIAEVNANAEEVGIEPEVSPETASMALV